MKAMFMEGPSVLQIFLQRWFFDFAPPRDNPAINSHQITWTSAAIVEITNA